jgi:hypothetical protein
MQAKRIHGFVSSQQTATRIRNGEQTSASAGKDPRPTSEAAHKTCVSCHTTVCAHDFIFNGYRGQAVKHCGACRLRMERTRQGIPFLFTEVPGQRRS